MAKIIEVKEREVLTFDEVQNIINSEVNFRNRVLLKLLYYSALRISEALNISVEHIDIPRRRITVVEGKGGKTAIVPILDRTLLSDLGTLIGKRKSGYLITKHNGERFHRTHGHLICKNAGVRANVSNPNPFRKHIHPHLLRHSRIRHLLAENYPMNFVQRLARHASVKTTMDTYGTMNVGVMQEYHARRVRDEKLLPQVDKHIGEIE